MKLNEIKEILDKYFCFPFLPEGMVSTKWIESKKRGDQKPLELIIKIGRRDICLNEDGRVTGAGTCLMDL